MWRFIILTFVFMAWGFYEFSGGADFDPEATRLSRIEAPALVEEQKLAQVTAEATPDAATPQTTPQTNSEVTRVALNLTSVDDVLRPGRATPRATVQANAEPATDVVQTVALQTEDTATDDADKPTIVLPSLVVDAAVITPVEFGASAVSDKEVRRVTGNSVNVRGGPGTGYSVVNRLVRGDEVEILQDPGNGWVKLRPVNGGSIGWMADFLLSNG